MNGGPPESIAADPAYRALVRRRARLAWGLVGLTFGALAAFLAALTLLPGLFARPLTAGSPVSAGMVAALVLMGLCLGVTSLYLHYCRTVFEPLQHEVLERLRGEADPPA